MLAGVFPLGISLLPQLFDWFSSINDLESEDHWISLCISIISVVKCYFYEVKCENAMNKNK